MDYISLGKCNKWSYSRDIGMGIRYFDNENRIEHKNQTKRSANKRRMIQYWYLTGISVDPHHYQNTQFFFSCLHNISSSSLSHSLSLLISDKNLVDHVKEKQTYPDYEVWFRLGVQLDSLCLKSDSVKIEDLIQSEPFLSWELSFLGIVLRFGKKAIQQ